MCTGMWRVAGWRLRWSSTSHPSRTGRRMSRIIASGLYSCASARPSSPRTATIPLNPRSRAISSSVLAKLSSSSTISTTRSPSPISARSSATLGSCDRSSAGSNSGAPFAAGAISTRSGSSGAATCGGASAGRKSVNVEPFAGRRLDADLAAEQPRDLAGDREAEPGAAVAARRRPVRLLERLEDQLQLVVRDPDAGVRHLEPHDARRRCAASARRTARPAARVPRSA